MNYWFVSFGRRNVSYERLTREDNQNLARQFPGNFLEETSDIGQL